MSDYKIRTDLLTFPSKFDHSLFISVYCTKCFCRRLLHFQADLLRFTCLPNMASSARSSHGTLSPARHGPHLTTQSSSATEGFSIVVNATLLSFLLYSQCDSKTPSQQICCLLWLSSARPRYSTRLSTTDEKQRLGKTAPEITSTFTIFATRFHNAADTFYLLSRLGTTWNHKIDLPGSRPRGGLDTWDAGCYEPFSFLTKLFFLFSYIHTPTSTASTTLFDLYQSTTRKFNSSTVYIHHRHQHDHAKPWPASPTRSSCGRDVVKAQETRHSPCTLGTR